MSYIDGFVAAVPTANKDIYTRHAKEAWDMFRDYGATRMVECWGDDVPAGKITDFQRSVQAKDDETVVFAWIEWPSKDLRDAGYKKMMDDPRMSMDNMPFDGKRMIYGGFSPLLDLKG
ncbi:hypothetical protein GCM10007276_07670 [Agaricicola taiwanensis]|uniref:DUF1428 domain-containing protein n=1 Tax=Agaricicola taiwanensis TaxID=591372 RepID=A0A8J2VJH5_9RHOB|nr:DUF1428 domain-containing protein [Agaricicola taiwanensis]GGE32878.1 hypothetical protein GCM10007276_07670 [Agaricicola taiwanensis]